MCARSSQRVVLGTEACRIGQDRAGRVRPTHPSESRRIGRAVVLRFRHRDRLCYAVADSLSVQPRPPKTHSPWSAWVSMGQHGSAWVSMIGAIGMGQSAARNVNVECGTECGVWSAACAVCGAQWCGGGAQAARVATCLDVINTSANFKKLHHYFGFEPVLNDICKFPIPQNAFVLGQPFARKVSSRRAI
jgi:hypothetical protein